MLVMISLRGYDKMEVRLAMSEIYASVLMVAPVFMLDMPSSITTALIDPMYVIR